MLSEKDVKEIFDKHGVVLKHGASYPKVLTWGGFQKAAHAIAEKMREGVAWEQDGWLEHGDRERFGLPGCRRGLTRIHLAKREEDEFNAIGHLEIWGIHGDDGQCARITVTLEEGGEGD